MRQLSLLYSKKNGKLYHSRLKKLVSKAHPNLFEMLKFLQGVQMTTESRLLQYAEGQKPPTKKQKYRTLETRLRTAKERLLRGDVTIEQYCDNVSHLIKLA